MFEPYVHLQRRRFIRLAVGGAVAAPIVGLLAPRSATGAAKPDLDPASEQAQQFSYTHDAEAVDDPAREAVVKSGIRLIRRRSCYRHSF